MTSISNTADFLRLLREDPEFRAEVRRELLTQELIELPEKFAAFVIYAEQNFAKAEQYFAKFDAFVIYAEQNFAKAEQYFAKFDAFVIYAEQNFAKAEQYFAKFDAFVIDTERNFLEIRGSIGRLEGMEYERRVSRTIAGAASRTLGLRRTKVIHSAAFSTNQDFQDEMLDAADAGAITEEQWHDLANADAIIVARKDGNTVYAVAEISVTINNADIERAKRRADILQKAAQVETYALVAGTRIPEQQLKQASQEGVTALTIQL